MKSVVVKISKNKAILLQSNDEFICLPNNNYVLGQVVNVNEKGGVKMSRIQKGLVAAVILVLLFSSLVYAYTVPQSYISLDVNPGIELEVNSFDRVVNVIGTNEDGTKVLNELDLKNMDVDEALQLIINQATMQGYIAVDEGNSILISVYNDDEDGLYQFKERVSNQVENIFKESNIEAQVIIVNIDENLMEDADELGVTAGKLALINAYSSYEYADKTQEELMNMSIYDIVSSIDDKEDFLDDEDVVKAIDTISGASVSESSDGLDVDTTSGASEDIDDGSIDTTSGASEDISDDEYEDDDDEDEYEDEDEHEDSHYSYGDDDDEEDDEHHDDDDEEDDEHDDD